MLDIDGRTKHASILQLQHVAAVLLQNGINERDLSKPRSFQSVQYITGPMGCCIPVNPNRRLCNMWTRWAEIHIVKIGKNAHAYPALPGIAILLGKKEEAVHLKSPSEPQKILIYLLRPLEKVRYTLFSLTGDFCSLHNPA